MIRLASISWPTSRSRGPYPPIARGAETAYQQVLAPRGYYPEFDFFRRECFGHDYGYFGPLLAPGASPEELRKIHREKKTCYASYLKYAVKNEHLFRLIHLMRSEYHTALVTAGSRANVATKPLVYRVRYM